MTTPRIQIRCKRCGSSDVRRDAWVEWDVEKQEWVLGTVFDAGHCEQCEGEASLEEVEIPTPCAHCGRTIDGMPRDAKSIRRVTICNGFCEKLQEFERYRCR